MIDRVLYFVPREGLVPLSPGNYQEFGWRLYAHDAQFFNLVEPAAAIREVNHRCCGSFAEISALSASSATEAAPQLFLKFQGVRTSRRLALRSEEVQLLLRREMWAARHRAQ